jgi:hypothetical protein
MRGSTRVAVLAAVLVLVIAACGDSSEETAAAETPTTVGPTTVASDSGSDTTGGAARLIVTSVGFGDDGFIAITNVGSVEGNLDGLFLCQRPAYHQLPDFPVAPGATVAVVAGDAAVEFPPEAGTIAGAVTAGGGFGSLSTDGEIGLYTSSNFGDADAIISYVEWGSTGHGRSATAVDAGIWDDGGFVDPAGGALIVLDGTNPMSESWAAG